MRLACKVRDSRPSTVVRLCQEFFKRQKKKKIIKPIQKINLTNGGNPSHTAGLIWKDTCSCWRVQRKLSGGGGHRSIFLGYYFSHKGTLSCSNWQMLVSKAKCSKILWPFSRVICSLLPKITCWVGHSSFPSVGQTSSKPKIFPAKSTLEPLHHKSQGFCSQRGGIWFFF